jgi:DNA-binding response OmpR family regulator
VTHPGSSKTLLVVANCSETLALVLEEAKSRGLSVITAQDPQVAIAMLDMAIPDILLTDLFLPEMSGLLLIREIRRRCPHMTVIAMAEEGNEGAMLESVRAGAMDYLRQPVAGDELAMALNRALQRIPHTIEDVPGIEQLDYRLIIGTDPAYVEPCVSWLIEHTAMTFPETQRLHLRATLIELIVNAVEHGSLEIFYQEKHEALSTDQFDTLIAERRRHPRFSARRVIVRATYDRLRRAVRYAITDQGNGFKWNRFLTKSHEPCDSLDANGRGVFLAKAFFPDLAYNDRGTEVTFSVPLP